MRRRTIRITLAIALPVLLVGGLIGLWLRSQMHADTFVGLLLDRYGLLPTSRLVDDVRSGDADRQREALALLRRRGDATAVPLALPLLASRDDYLWLAAATYLGVNGRAEAVPYLIKALRHTAWRADADTLALLTTLTGQTIGNDFDAWRRWYADRPGAIAIDWESDLGHAPRLRPTATGPSSP